MVKKTESITKASKGLVKDFNLSRPSPSAKAGEYEYFPRFERAKAFEMITKDETVKAAIITLTDKSLEYGYSISSEDGKSNLKAFKDDMKKVRFDKVLRQIFSNLYGYNNTFVEIVKDDNNKFKELHLLETTHTEPQATVHGKVEGYIQEVTGYDVDEYPTWTDEEVSHISIDDMSESVWSDIALESVYKYVLLKEYIYTYYGWFFGTNQKRNLINIKDANDESVKALLSYMKRQENDITKHIPFAGELEKISLGDLSDADKALSLIDKCDGNILKLMQVPSIAANETGNSNRSSGDKQDEFLVTRIKAVHKAVTEACENDLFGKMGYPKILISFNNPTKTNLELVLQNAEKMKIIGFSSKKIEEYFKSVNFPVEGKLIDEELFKPEVPEVSEANGVNGEAKSEEQYPSRKRKASDATSKEIGTGESSTSRKEQFVAKSFEGLTYRYNKKKQLGGYPYVY
jgi:hypothetical protein